MSEVLVIESIATQERGPEKAGVGASIPSLATMFNHLQTPLFRGHIMVTKRICSFALATSLYGLS